MKLFKKFNKITSIGLIALILAFYLGPFVPVAHAAALTSLSDTLSRLKISTASTHTMKFTTPTGAGINSTIILTFPSDFNFTSAVITDVTLTHGGGSGTTYTETLAASPTTTVWGAVFSGTQNRVLTLTAPSTTGTNNTILAGEKVIISYVTAAHFVNGSSAATQYDIALSGTFGDTGDITVYLLADDQVSVTATVNESITFAITDTTIGFGTLTSANARFATGNLLGADGPSPTSAHTMTVATNGAAGYSLTYNGATLTSTAVGSPTIDVATISGDQDGTPNTEQFAINFSTDGGGTIVSAYAHASNNYSFVASTTTQIASKASPATTETFTGYYLANISGATEAGAYSTAITYVATANF